MNIKKLYKCSILLAFVFALPTAVAIAQKLPPPESCTPFPGVTVSVDKDTYDWPVQATCMDGSEEVPCWKYMYTSTHSFSNYSQTLPGMGWEPIFTVYPPPDSFSSITFNSAGAGSSINDKLFWGQGIFERSIIDFVSAPTGEPSKFGYAANQGGVGWTSMKFKMGNQIGYCAIAGPDYETTQTRIIKPVIKWVLFENIRVRFEINYEGCTYRAFQETDENGFDMTEIELEQNPVSEILITINGDTGFTRENNSPGKCDETSFAYGDGTCGTYLLGGKYVKVCW